MIGNLMKVYWREKKIEMKWISILDYLHILGPQGFAHKLSSGCFFVKMGVSLNIENMAVKVILDFSYSLESVIQKKIWLYLLFSYIV